MRTNFSAAHKAIIDDITSAMPGVKVGKAFGYPAYKVGGKVFCFIGESGIALKLPPEQVQALIVAHDTMTVFQPTEGIIWKSWVSIDRENAADHHQDVDLLEEAMQYVAGGA
jgi:hypothetical protein